MFCQIQYLHRHVNDVADSIWHHCLFSSTQTHNGFSLLLIPCFHGFEVGETSTNTDFEGLLFPVFCVLCPPISALGMGNYDCQSITKSTATNTISRKIPSNLSNPLCYASKSSALAWHCQPEYICCSHKKQCRKSGRGAVR